MNRRIPKSEIAKRVSYMNANFVQQVMREWLYDAVYQWILIYIYI